MQSIKAASVYDLISNNQMAIMLIKKEKPIMIICKLSILKALPDTESDFSLSLVSFFSPFYFIICLYVLKLYLHWILNNN